MSLIEWNICVGNYGRLSFGRRILPKSRISICEVSVFVLYFWVCFALLTQSILIYKLGLTVWPDKWWTSQAITQTGASRWWWWWLSAGSPSKKFQPHTGSIGVGLIMKSRPNIFVKKGTFVGQGRYVGYVLVTIQLTFAEMFGRALFLRRSTKEIHCRRSLMILLSSFFLSASVYIESIIFEGSTVPYAGEHISDHALDIKQHRPECYSVYRSLNTDYKRVDGDESISQISYAEVRGVNEMKECQGVNGAGSAGSQMGKWSAFPTSHHLPHSFMSFSYSWQG